MTNYPRIYALLKRAGHSPLYAAQIALDAACGDRQAIAWVRIVWAARHGRR